MIRTLIFRHGQSVANAATRSIMTNQQDQIPPEFWEMSDHDYPLTADGTREAKILSQNLLDTVKNKKVVAVSSPFIRAVETAKIALPDVEWVLDRGMAERDYGSIAELKRLNLPEQLASEQRRSNSDPDYRPCGDGETFREACHRVGRCFSYWQSVASSEGADMLILSAHGDAIRALKSHILETDPGKTPYWFHIGNCQIHHFTANCPEGSSNTGLWHAQEEIPYDQKVWEKLK